MVPGPQLSTCFLTADLGQVLLGLLEMCVCSSLSSSPQHCGAETPQPTPRNQWEGGDGSTSSATGMGRVSEFFCQPGSGQCRGHLGHTDSVTLDKLLNLASKYWFLHVINENNNVTSFVKPV